MKRTRPLSVQILLSAQKGNKTHKNQIYQTKKRKALRNVVKGTYYMAFFASAIGVLQTLVIAIGAGLGVWGVINLMEGYGNDNPGANAHVR